jgi:hypothetical protein
LLEKTRIFNRLNEKIWRNKLTKSHQKEESELIPPRIAAGKVNRSDYFVVNQFIAINFKRNPNIQMYETTSAF